MLSRITPAITAAALGLVAAPACAQWDAISGYYFNENAYLYEVEGLVPDFDQRRDGDPWVVGLPNGGRYYCGPTATMNTLAWVAAQGWFGISPGVGPWDQLTNRNWGETARVSYNFISDQLADLGVNFMSTNPDGGTGARRLREGTRDWIAHWGGAEAASTFTVSTVGVDGGNWNSGGANTPTTEDIAVMGRLGAVMVMRWGYYDIDQDTSPPTLLARTGGHMVSLRRVHRNGDDEFVKYTNPGSGDATDREADFVSHTRRVQRVFFQDPDGDLVERSVLMTPDQTFADVGESDVRILDDVMAIRPRGGFSVDSTLGRINFHSLSLDGGIATPITFPVPIPAGLELVDAALSPDGLRIAATVRLEGLPDGALMAFDLRNGQWSTLLTLDDPGQLVFTRQRTIFAEDGGTIVHADPFADGNHFIDQVTPGFSSDDIRLGFSPLTDRVFALAPDEGLLISMPTLQLDDPKVYDVSSIPWGADTDFTLDPISDDAWFVTNGDIYELEDLSEPTSPIRSWTIAGGGAGTYAASINSGDDGRLHIVADNGAGRIIQELRVFSPFLFSLVSGFDSPYNGLALPDTTTNFRLLNGFTNQNPFLNFQPGSDDVDITTIDDGQGDPLPPSQICDSEDAENLGGENVVVPGIEIDGVGVTISTANSASMRVRSYGPDGQRAFEGVGGPDSPFSPMDVSGAWFLSTSGPNGDDNPFQDVNPIVFTPNQPIQRFGLTTLDLLEDTVAAGDTVHLRAYDSAGNLVAEHTRTGVQGPGGVSLFWLVESDTANIARVELAGSISAGGGYGIDDVALCPGCPADLAEPFGQLDFSDVLAFLTAFGAMAPEADLADPFGSFDFSDVVQFLVYFGAGCP